MNWQHLQTFLWLRWRLSANFIRRHGSLNLIITSVGAAIALVGSITGFFVALTLGIYFLRDLSPANLMYAFDGWAVGFLFFWLTGLLTELQRGEMLSLDKLLHLPTSLHEVYAFNFISSLITFATLTLVPPMVGFSIAAVLAKGAACIVLLTMIPAFVLMIGAVTYQFRGWLATLMANKRRQRTIMVVITFFFVIIAQAPQLANLAFQRQFRQARTHDRDARQQLRQKLQSRQITPDEYGRAEDELTEREAAESQALTERFHRWVRIANLVLPFGWIAYGAEAAATGNPWPGLAATLAMSGIAALSLLRSYRTTLRYFTGDSTDNIASAIPAQGKVTPARRDSSSNWIEWKLSFVSEPIAAMTMTTLRSVTRAPEVKLALLGPLVMLIVFGGILAPTFGAKEVPVYARSLAPIGLLGLSLMSIAQLAQNHFALDRSGFRSYVLSGISRRDILIAKNLALAPFVMIPALVLMTVMQCLVPAQVTHFVAAVLEIPLIYLMLCLLGNLSSILSPIGQAAGSMKPANASGITMFLQFVFALVTMMVVAAVAVLPLGMEWLLQWLGWLPPSVPLALLAAILELVAGVLLYRTFIEWQGTLLQSRECKILEAVVEKGE